MDRRWSNMIISLIELLIGNNIYMMKLLLILHEGPIQKLKVFGINPDIPICVGYWEGGNIQPAAKELLGTGMVADLLRLVKNPKIANTASKSVAVSKGGKSVSEPIKMVYTIYIWYRDNSSSSDNTSGSLSDIGDDRKETHLVTCRKKSRSISPVKCFFLSASTLSPYHSSNRKPISISTKSSTTTTKSTQYSDTKEQSIPSAIAFQPLQDPKSNPITPPRTQLAGESTNTLIPLDSDPQIIRKRSLTLLSPERVTI